LIAGVFKYHQLIVSDIAHAPLIVSYQQKTTRLAAKDNKSTKASKQADNNNARRNMHYALCIVKHFPRKKTEFHSIFPVFPVFQVFFKFFSSFSRNSSFSGRSKTDPYCPVTETKKTRSF
jgi:hypothetical protein